jgi:hypothetical protein
MDVREVSRSFKFKRYKTRTVSVTLGEVPLYYRTGQLYRNVDDNGNGDADHEEKFWCP